MTVEKVESQRLISVSLGKIASSRAQRGGINLHKNLLVASVLHKARTVFIMENYSHVIANRKAQQQKKSWSKAVPDGKPDTTTSTTSEAMPRVGGGVDEFHQASECKADREIVVTVHVTCSSEGIDSSPENVCSGKENSPPIRDSSEDMDTGDVIENIVEDVASSDRLKAVVSELNRQNNHNSDCDNINNNDVVNMDSDSKSACDINKTDSTVILPLRESSSSKQCPNVTNVKSSPNRKRSRFPKSLNIAAKKIKYDSDSEYDSDTESIVSSKDLKCNSPQITNLVSIFNSGFNGLCNKSTGSTCSTVSNTHCSSELKDNSLDQLSIMPAIALTV